MSACSLCDGGCAEADLQPLLDPSLAWLWERVAVIADRRGDPQMRTGTLRVIAPADPQQRAAAIGLLGGRTLSAGQSRTVALEELTGKLALRGPTLTPGAVAAHAVGRKLAARAEAKLARGTAEQRMQQAIAAGFDGQSDAVWQHLKSSGWVARLAAGEEPAAALTAAVDVYWALPDPKARVDRRRLANERLGSPHALDEGTLTCGLVLALAAGTGRLERGVRGRWAWRALGVECDELTGGLIAVGIAPAGWNLPRHAAVTIPPRELADCPWSAPASEGALLHVTENPSVATAAADLAREREISPLLCTAGTPSALEVQAIAGLARAGWHVAVRADFDAAGLAHVNALLRDVPGSTPWRMDTESYLASVQPEAVDPPQLVGTLPATPWDLRLRPEMLRVNLAAFEEMLLPHLLADLYAQEPAEYVSGRSQEVR